MPALYLIGHPSMVHFSNEHPASLYSAALHLITPHAGPLAEQVAENHQALAELSQRACKSCQVTCDQTQYKLLHASLHHC